MQSFEFKATSEFVGSRIDKFLSKNINEISRSSIANIIENGGATVNGKPVNKKYKLKENDNITFTVPDPVEYDVEPENIPLDIVYEDDDLLVVNKPKGMVVHPAPGNYSGTLVNALLYHCKDSLSGINGVLRPGIVHRIDKNTSGLLIVAKNDKAHNHLALQIKEHSFKREYQAVVYGNVKENGTVDAPIGRNKIDRKKMCVTYENSKNAVTHYEVISSFNTSANSFTHIRCILETGRTHQIRVHMAHIGHPVAGDDVYGPKKVIKSLNGQCLHAKVIGFIHPRTGEYIEFNSDLPPYFTKFLNRIS
ncbi:MAG: RluA family pseudouridine synthase [Ruminococcus sp.]|nr:RluA family pseudouridine synthase [Ruminococcus sp.]